MQQIPIVASRLHVVAAVLEAKAGLPACLRGLLLGPSEESDFGARDGVVNNAAGFFRDFWSEDAQEVLRSRASRLLQDAEGQALHMVRLGRLLDYREERLEIFPYLFGLLP